MRRFCQMVFDDFVVGTTTVYTSPIYEDTLGTADRLAIQAVADQVSGSSPRLTVQVEHGSDGRNWTAKSGTPEINNIAIDTGSTVTLTGTEPGTNPSHTRIRLRIALAGTAPQAHVKLYVTGRDRVP